MEPSPDSQAEGADVNNAEKGCRLLAPSETIESGPWRLQLRGEEVAGIEYRGYPVLRAIRPVVRDDDWRTLPSAVESVLRSKDAGGITIGLTVGFAGFGAEYRANLTLRLSADELTVLFDGVASYEFRSNRIGLVVLHRPDDAGRNISITAPDHTRTPLEFPVDISPHQPFVDIAAMDWSRDGTAFQLEFSGDVFETEDQRNWTDASFKTYSTPLSLPFPVTVNAGDRISQSVRLTAKALGPVPEPAQPRPQPAVLTVRAQALARVPALGTLSSRSSAPLEPVPRLDSLLVELVGSPSGAAELARCALRQATELGVQLDVRIAVSGPARLPGLLDLLPLEQVTRLGVFSSESHVTEPDLWGKLQTEAQRRGYTGTLLAGARSHFTELNRSADRLPHDAEAITYSITPQMHTTDVQHVVETLPIQRQTALNALRIGSGKPLHIGPITLKARFNAVSTNSAYDPRVAEAMAADPLQGEDFTAAWLLGSIAALTLPGVETISYFEASGPRGLRTDSGAETPAHRLLTEIAALRGSDVLKIDGDIPGLVLYPVKGEAGGVLFAANLTPEPLRAAIRLENGFTRTIDIPAWTAISRPLG